MRRSIVACVVITFLASPLNADEAGSGFASGLAKGAGAGGGSKEPVQDSWSDNTHKSSGKLHDQIKTLLVKPNKGKPDSSKLEQEKDKQ